MPKKPKAIGQGWPGSIYDIEATVMQRQRQYVDEYSARDELKNESKNAYIRQTLSMLGLPLMRGFSVQTVGYAVGLFTIMSVAHPEIRKDLPRSVYDSLAPYAKSLAERSPRYKSFYDKCMLKGSSAHVPYTPETAAMDEISLEMRIYKEQRDPARIPPSVDVETYKQMLQHHSDQRADLLKLFAQDGVDPKELQACNHKLVANIVMNDPAARVMFTQMAGTDNFYDRIRESATAHNVTVKNGKVMQQNTYYTIPDEGIPGLEGRFGCRAVTDLLDYQKMIYDYMSPHYGEILESKRFGRELSENAVKSTDETQIILSMMTADGYQEDTIMSVMKEIEKKCQDEYVKDHAEEFAKGERMRQEQGQRSEDRQSFTDEENVFHGESFEKEDLERESVLKQFRIGTAKDDGSVILLSTYDGDSRGSYSTNGYFKFQQADEDRIWLGPEIGEDYDSIEFPDPLFTKEDRHQLLSLMQKTFDLQDPDNENPFLMQYDSEENRTLYDRLLSAENNDEDMTMRELTDSFLMHMSTGYPELSDEVKQNLDLIYAAVRTDRPIIGMNEKGEQFLVATRSMGSNIGLGTVGANIDKVDHLHLDRNCFIDDSCKLSGDIRLENKSEYPLLVCMDSKLDEVKIYGDGVIANSTIYSASPFGRFDPVKNRTEKKAGSIFRKMKFTDGLYGEKLRPNIYLADKYGGKDLRDMYRATQESVHRKKSDVSKYQEIERFMKDDAEQKINDMQMEAE